MDEPFFLLHHKLKEQCEKYPDRVILEYYSAGSYKPYTYSDIYQRTLHFSRELTKTSPEKTGNIAIIADNCPEWFCAYCATLFAGGTNVPLDPQLPDQDILVSLKDAQTKTIFTSSKYSQRLNSLKQSLPVIENILLIDELTGAREADLQYPEIPAGKIEDIASLIYTSGTTALPKGVMLTHKNLSANYNSIKQLNLVGEDDILLSILPFHHSYPFMATLLFPLLSGAKTIIAQTFKGEELLRIMREKGVSIMVGVPQLYKVLNDNITAKLKQIPYPLRITGRPFIRRKLRRQLGARFRFFLSGGAKLDEKVARSMLRLGLPVIEGYGLTETSPVVTMNPAKNFRIGSAGRAVPGVTIKIPEKTGEILIKGENVMRGYYRRPEETNNAIKDGWFHSGDLGHIDKDGYLYITGRLKEIIVLSSGKNIYPEELESYYRQIPFIKEICIIAKPAGEKPEAPESLWAIIVPDLEFMHKTDSVDIHNSLDWALKSAMEQLPPYRRVSGFTIIREELPRTRLGKVKRYEVENKYRQVVLNQSLTTKPAAPLSAEDKILARTPLAQNTISAIAARLKPQKEVSLNDHLELDLGIDSLGRIELLVAIENKLGIKLPEQLLSESYTVGDLILKIRQQLESSPEKLAKPQTADWAKLLSQPPAEKLTKNLDLSPGTISFILNFISLKFTYILYRYSFSVKVLGKENIPRYGPYIICSNHQSYLDGPLIACSMPFRPEMNLFFLGYRYYFELPLLRDIVKLARIIPVSVGANLIDSLRISSYILKKHKSLCIFPEGERSPDGTVQKFKKGIGILLKHTPVPVIPVSIQGSYSAWPVYRKLPRRRPITITYGKPIAPEELLTKSRQPNNKDTYTSIANSLQKAFSSQ